jgi:hypothetical protein
VVELVAVAVVEMEHVVEVVDEVGMHKI